MVALARTLVEEPLDEAEQNGEIEGEDLPERRQAAVALLLALDGHGDAVSGVAVFPSTALVSW
ncbi:MAG: hypothetical protein PHX99_06635 [Synergistaceae bacterium]|nr:hypothetical protein [Synergistaceae bacterium]